MASNWREWVVDRFGWTPFSETVLHRRVAKGSWYYGDGATLLLLLGIQVVTGMLMTLTYSPSPETAYESVQYITNEQMLGWLIRGLHYWSAGLMVFMLVFHLFREILVGGYKSPREGTWLIGVLLFFTVLLMAYSGYTLRWDETAVYAIRVGLHNLYRVPLIGEGLVLFAQGGPEMGGQTLTRFYALHVLFLPLLVLFLVGYHLYLVMVHSITSFTERERPVHSAEEQREIYKQDAESEDRGETFYPDTMISSGAMAIVVGAVAVALTLIIGPPRLDPEANLVERAFPAEEWWFGWYSALIALMPPILAPVLEVGFPILVFVILVALPFVDRGPHRGMRKRPIAVTVVLLCVIALVYLSDLRRRSPWTGWPDPNPPPVPREVVLDEEAEQGRQLYARYGCTTCHAIAGHGREVGTDLAALRRRYSHEELRDYILNPPEGIAMPSYEGRIPEDELNRIVEFVLVAQTFPAEQ